MNSYRLIRFLYDKAGRFKLGILATKLFVFGLVIKLYASAFLGGENFTALFIPFAKHFIFEQGSTYQHFLSLGITEVFPYPMLMLYILAIPGFIFYPLLNSDIFIVTSRELLIFSLPILIADIALLLILSRWLKNKHRELLWFYWLSPVLFYINYIHSQLDVIPITLTFIFLYFLFKEKWATAFFALGSAIATKFHIAILFPFTLIYLWRKRVKFRLIALYSSIVILVFLLINNFHLLSQSFQTIVFGNREQNKIFDLQIALSDGNIIYLIPMAYTLLLLHAVTFKRFNRDTFIMFIGFGFGLLTLGIPPMQGWYYWILPFFIYFIVKHDTASKVPFAFMSLTYLIYFALVPNSDYLYVFSIIAPSIAEYPNLYEILSKHGVDASLISNLTLTLLQSTLLANVFWLYRRGVEESRRQKLYNMPYLIGVAGDSGSGKSTFADLMTNLFGNRHVALVAGDAMHKWERNSDMWNKYTHLDPRANQLHTDIEYARTLQRGEDIFRRQYDHKSGTFTKEQRLQSKTLVLFEGLHSFFLDDMRQALDLKIFIKPDETLRTHWKVRRDINDRGYTKEKSLTQIKARANDAKEYITAQAKHADIIFAMKVLEPISEKDLGTEFTPLVYLEIRCKNTVHLEPLILSLEPYLNIEHTITDKHQFVSFAGSISGAVIEHLSYELLPELPDVTTNDPHFQNDHNGLIQLFLAYYIFESLHYQQKKCSLPQRRNDTALTEISSASQELGSDTHFVQGGGGNVSLKLNDHLMAVKASVLDWTNYVPQPVLSVLTTLNYVVFLTLHAQIKNNYSSSLITNRL